MTQKPPIPYRIKPDLEKPFDKMVSDFAKDGRKRNWIINEAVRDLLIKHKYITKKK